jgi:hypothetical protein
VKRRADKAKARLRDPTSPTGRGEWERKVKRSLHVERTWPELVARGCHERPLLDLLFPCVRCDWDLSRRQKDVDDLKLRCDRLVKKLKSVATDSEILGRMRVEHMGGMPLSSILALPVNLGIGLGIDPPADFFDRWPTDLRAHAAHLEGLKRSIVQGWSVRQHSASEYVLMLYLYCGEATTGKARWRHIADLLNAGWEAMDIYDNLATEDVLRMQIRRLGRPKAGSLFEHLETLMKRYVVSHPTGDLSFTEWGLTRNLVLRKAVVPARTESPYEELARISKERERLLAVPDLTDPTSPQELEAQIRSLMGAFRSPQR